MHFVYWGEGCLVLQFLFSLDLGLLKRFFGHGLFDDIRHMFSNCNDGSICVATDDVQHDWSIHHAEPWDLVDAKGGIDHQGGGIHPHGTNADRMVHQTSQMFGVAGPIGIAQEGEGFTARERCGGEEQVEFLLFRCRIMGSTVTVLRP